MNAHSNGHARTHTYANPSVRSYAAHVQDSLGLGVREPLATYEMLRRTDATPKPTCSTASTRARTRRCRCRRRGDSPPLGFALAQLHGIYVLAENAHGLVLVDMHAAHERITYEKLKAAQDGEGIRSQLLLVPLTLAVSEREAAAIEEHGERFADLGFDIARSGSAEHHGAPHSGAARRCRCRRPRARRARRPRRARRHAPHRGERERTVVDDGLSWFGARQPPPDDSRK